MVAAGVLFLVVFLVLVPSASAYWSPAVSAPSGPTCGAPTCYVWRAPDGTIVEGVKQITQVQFENEATEIAATIDEVAGRPTTGIGTVEVEGGKAAASALETETDVGVLTGAEDAIAASGTVSLMAPVALGAAAGLIGWEIGGAIDALIGIEGFGSIFGSGSTPSTTRYEAKEVFPVHKGDVITENGSAESPRVFDKAPAEGFKLGFCLSNNFSCGTKSFQVYESGTHTTKEGSTLITEGVAGGYEFGEVIHSKEGFGVGGYFTPYEVQKLVPKGGKTLAENFPGVTAVRFSTWSSPSLAKQQEEIGSRVLENPRDQKFVEWLPHHDGGASGVSLAEFISVPSCIGDSYAACVARLEERGLVPHRIERNWETADITQPADDVLELEPAKSTEVERGSTVKVKTNPSAPNMPVIIPAPGPNETYSQYVASLNPALSPHEVILGELNEDPTKGPNAVSTTVPAPGTRVDPSTTTAVSVRVNPADAPPSTGGAPGSGFVPPTVPAISAPFAGINPCGVFPFGLFCWIKDGIAGFEVDPKCPSAQVPLGEYSGKKESFELGFCNIAGVDHWVGIFRTIVVFVFTVGCAWTFAKATGAIGGGGDE